MINEIVNKIREFFYYWECKIFPIDIEEIYMDQAGRRLIFGDRCISSFYTSYGIRQIDSEYSNRIRNLNENPKNLKKEIKTNPHLHKRIKRNLLFNLRNYTS